MKKTTLFKTVLLLCALIVGSGSAWAADPSITLTATNLELTGSYSSSAEVTVGGVTFVHTNLMKNSSNIQVKASTGVIYNKTAFPEDIQSVAITHSGTARATTISGSSDGKTWTTVKSGNGSITGDFSGNSYKYFKITRGENAAYWTQVVITYKETPTGTGDATTVTIDESGITNTNLFVDTSAGSLSASVTETESGDEVTGAAVTWSSSDEEVATINETTGVVTLVGAGTTTITASYAGVEDEYLPSSDTYELTVIDEDPDAVTLWSENFGNYSANDVPSGADYGDGFDYTCNDGESDTKIYAEYLAGGTSPELLVGKSGGYFEAVIPLKNIKGDLKLTYKTNANSHTISTSTDGISISGTASYSTAGEHTVSFTGVTTSMTSITIKFAAGSKNVRLDDIVLKGSKVAPVTMGTNGYATFASSDKLDLSNLPEGLTAYRATVEDATVKFDELSQRVHANTGIMLKGTASTTYNIPVVLSSSDIEENNDFKVNTSGTTFTPDANFNYFGLKRNTLIFGLFDPATVAIPADKAYLKVATKADGARELTCVFDDGETTGINEIVRLKTTIESECYNLNGQRVNANHKGIVIVNGKKFFNK